MQTVWIGIAVKDLEDFDPLAKENCDRGIAEPGEAGAGIEAVSLNGQVLGYGIIANEDFPDTFDLGNPKTFQAFIPGVRHALESYRFRGTVAVYVQETDPSIYPERPPLCDFARTSAGETIH